MAASHGLMHQLGGLAEDRRESLLPEESSFFPSSHQKTVLAGQEEDMDELWEKANDMVKQTLNHVESDKHIAQQRGMKQSYSGLNVTSSDNTRIVNPQHAPHSFLPLSREVEKFEKLNLRKFVLGELNILSRPGITLVEYEGRMALMK